MRTTALLLLPALAICQQTGVEGPSIGLVWDGASREIRPVRGIPGASTQGPRLEGSPEDIQFAAASSRGDALAIAAGQLHHFRAGRWLLLEAPAGATHAYFSANGEKALVRFEDGSLKVIAGLPSTPTLTDAAPVLPPAPFYAISNDASVMLAVQPDDGIAWISNASGHQWRLHIEGQVRSAELVSGDGKVDALVASSTGVWRVRDVAGAAETQLLWTGDARFVAAARTGIVLVVADGGKILAIDPQTQDVRTIEAPVQATELVRMTKEDVFRLGAASQGTLWMIDISQNEPYVFFVPAPGV